MDILLKYMRNEIMKNITLSKHELLLVSGGGEVTTLTQDSTAAGHQQGTSAGSFVSRVCNFLSYWQGYGVGPMSGCYLA
jgi:hypothetical protein